MSFSDALIFEFIESIFNSLLYQVIQMILTQFKKMLIH